ncbi:MAG: 4Fe-4S binding protein [Planctomycetota bacterium]|jgi:Fe-S-cluster-containing hydrogenase component 2
MIIADITKCSGCGRCEMACSFQRDREYSRAKSVIKLMKEEALGLDVPVACIMCCRCVESCSEDALSFTARGLIKLDSEKCNGCGECEKSCPVGVIEFEDKPFFCTACGKCVESCNLGALELAECMNPPEAPSAEALKGKPPTEKRYLWVIGQAMELPWIKEEHVRIYR